MVNLPLVKIKKLKKKFFKNISKKIGKFTQWTQKFWPNDFSVNSGNFTNFYEILR
jgi:hypothetical protein